MAGIQHPSEGIIAVKADKNDLTTQTNELRVSEDGRSGSIRTTEPAADCHDSDRIVVHGNSNTVLKINIVNSDSNIDICFGEKRLSIKEAKNKVPTASGDRSGSTASRIEHLRSKSPVPPRVKITGLLKSNYFKDIVHRLSYYTQRGLWSDLNICCRQLCEDLEDAEHSDIEIVVISYQIIADCLQMNIHDAVQLMVLAYELLPCSQNEELLRARLLYNKGYIQRKDNDYLQAQTCFEDALKIFQTIEPCFFQGAAQFHLACVKYSCLPENKDDWEKDALQDIIADITQALHIFESSDMRVIVNIEQRAIVMKAMVLIDCGSSVGRRRPLDETCRKVERARFILKGLDLYRDRAKPSKYINCNNLLGQANCHYRLAQCALSSDIAAIHYQKAHMLALHAFEVAEKHGFKSEIRSIHALLDDISPYITFDS